MSPLINFLYAHLEDFQMNMGQNRFHGGTIYNDDASGLIWVENQVSLRENETVLGKSRFEE